MGRPKLVFDLHFSLSDVFTLQVNFYTSVSVFYLIVVRQINSVCYYESNFFCFFVFDFFFQIKVLHGESSIIVQILKL